MAADIIQKVGDRYFDSMGHERNPMEPMAIQLPEGVGIHGVGAIHFSDTGATFDCEVTRIGNRFLFEIGEKR
jgi:hypothetical protein